MNSEKIMPKTAQGPEQQEGELVKAIRQRAQTASEKVKERVESRFIPKMNQMGNYAMRHLGDLENDFFHLAKDPNDPCGGGHYEGWTSDEIKELYFVLYGEKMEELDF